MYEYLTKGARFGPLILKANLHSFAVQAQVYSDHPKVCFSSVARQARPMGRFPSSGSNTNQAFSRSWLSTLSAMKSHKIRPFLQTNSFS